MRASRIRFIWHCVYGVLDGSRKRILVVAAGFLDAVGVAEIAAAGDGHPAVAQSG